MAHRCVLLSLVFKKLYTMGVDIKFGFLASLLENDSEDLVRLVHGKNPLELSRLESVTLRSPQSLFSLTVGK